MADGKDPSFDPYHKWLGIPKHQRPPTLYQLLGLSQGECDCEVIEEAAVRQSTHLRTYQIGVHADDCTRLLNEIGRAQQVLLNPQKKRDYDERLAQQAAKANAAAPSEQFSAQPTPAKAKPFELSDESPAPKRGKSADDVSARRPAKKSVKKDAQTFSIGMIAAMAGGGLAIVLAIGAAAWMMSGSPPRKLNVVADADKKPKDNRPEEVAKPTKRVEAAIEPVVPIPQVIEPPRKKEPIDELLQPDPAEESEFLGEWQSVFKGPPRLNRRVFVQKTAKGEWRAYTTYLSDDGTVAGAGHAKNIVFANSQLQYTLVHDVKPAPIWPGDIAFRVHFKQNELTRFRRDLLEVFVLNNKPQFRGSERAPPNQALRSLSGGWRAALEDGTRIELDLHRYDEPGGKSKMSLKDSKGAPTTSPCDILRPYGEALAFEIDFAQPPAEPWTKATRAILTPVGGQLRAMFFVDGKPAFEVPLSRDAQPPVVAKIVPKGKTPDAIVPDIVKPETVKLDPPAKDKIAEAQKIIQEQFGKDFAAAKKSAAERTTLAEKLFKLAEETADDPPARYVLFGEARDLACQAGKWPLAAAAIDALRDEFGVDAIAQRETALTLLFKSTVPKTAAEDAGKVALATVFECLAADRVESAQTFLNLAKLAAQKAPSLSLAAITKKLEPELKRAAADHERMKKAEATLAKSPEDAAANLDVGRYLVLFKGDWARGLPYLAKGNGDWLNAARRDLEAPDDAKKQQEVADAWWNLADKESGLARSALQQRARHWYRAAVEQAAGLTRAVINDRIKLIDDAPSWTPKADSAPMMTEIRRMNGHSAAVTGLQIMPDGKTVCSGSLDISIRQWDLATGKLLANLKVEEPVLTFSISPSLRYAAAVSKTGLTVWDWSTRKRDGAAPGVMPGSFWTGDNAYFWVYDNARYETHDFFKRELLTAGKGFPVPGATLVGRHNKSYFVTLGDDVRYFRSASTVDTTRNKLSVPDATCAAFSPDGAWLLIGSSDKRIRQIDATTEQVLATFAAAEIPRSLAISSDGRRFLSGGDDKVVHLWKVGSPKEIAHSPAQQGAIHAVAFTLDNSKAVSAGTDAAIVLWNLPASTK